MEKEEQMFGNQYLPGRAEMRGHRVHGLLAPPAFPTTPGLCSSQRSLETAALGN